MGRPTEAISDYFIIFFRSPYLSFSFFVAHRIFDAITRIACKIHKMKLQVVN